MKSAFQQYIHAADGTVSVNGLPGVMCEVIQEQGRATARDLEHELRLPHFYQDWERMAKVRGFSRRKVRCVLMDESVTRFPGHPRLQPEHVTLPPLCLLEFGHHGFAVGLVFAFYFVAKESRDSLTHLGIEVPAEGEGDCVIAEAQLFDSPLAEKAWEALERGIFTHVCPLILRQDPQPLGTGGLVEVSLVDGDYPGCPGALILKTWEA